MDRAVTLCKRANAGAVISPLGTVARWGWLLANVRRPVVVGILLPKDVNGDTRSHKVEISSL